MFLSGFAFQHVKCALGINYSTFGWPKIELQSSFACQGFDEAVRGLGMGETAILEVGKSQSTSETTH